MEVDKKKFGARIRDWRKEKGLTQDQLGNLFEDKELNENKANKGIISAWERGDSVPSPYRLKKLSELMEVSIDELLYGSTEDFIYSVLESDIEEGGRFFETAVEYLTNTTDLYDIEGAIFFDDDGKMIDIDDTPQIEFDIKKDSVRQLVDEKSHVLIPIIKSHLNGSYDEDLVINEAVNLVNTLYMSDILSFEGQYYTIRKTFNDMIPSFMGNASIEELKNVNLERGNTSEKEAYKKAIDQYYQNKLLDLRFEFTDELETLFREYKEDLKKYSE